MNKFSKCIWLLHMIIFYACIGKEQREEKEWSKGFSELIRENFLPAIQTVPYIIYILLIPEDLSKVVLIMNFIYIVLLTAYMMYLFKRVKKENRNKYLIVSAIISSAFFVCCYLFLPIK